MKLNPRGVVEVDNHFQTSIEGIYAAGDVIGPSLASVSAEQGRVAACHALGLGFKVKLDRYLSQQFIQFRNWRESD